MSPTGDRGSATTASQDPDEALGEARQVGLVEQVGRVGHSVDEPDHRRVGIVRPR